MEKIFAIAISDFQEKIHFFQKQPNFNFDLGLKITKSINKSLGINYLKEHISKGVENRLMDTMINAQMKVKISILGEIIVKLIYDVNIDIFYINQINQRLIESLYNIAKTKKLRMELLVKKYVDITYLIQDTLNMLDPRLRLTTKAENLSLRDMISVFI